MLAGDAAVAREVPFARLSNLRYRPEIDGLRSLAILPVVFFHFGARPFAGGFVGVDVFFVISGFLITSLLLKDITGERFSLVTFYERRARRILPALFFMLIVVASFSMFFLLPFDLMDLGKSLIAAVGFVANAFFRLQSGYFDRGTAVRPLLHTWSLSVEEQFYLLFPLALFAITKLAGRRLVPVLAAAAIGSFAASVFYTGRSPNFAFYLPITRAWELLGGSLLACNAFPVTSRRWVRDIESVAGMLLIGFSVLSLNKTMSFPGWLAALPCVGAALVIHAIMSGSSFGAIILSWRPLVFIGALSYSLYLWHWPAIVFVHYALDRDLNPVEVAVLLVAIFAVSAFSWKFIESPFRRLQGGYDRRAIFIGSGAGMVLLWAVGATFVMSHGLPARLPPEARRLITMDRGLVNPSCFNTGPRSVRTNALCVIGDHSDAIPTFIVWGDSHADRIAIPIGEAASARGLRGYLASEASCPPLLEVRSTLPDCKDYNDAVLDLVRRKHISMVVISAIWANYAEGSRFGTEIWTGVDPMPRSSAAREALIRRYRDAFKREFVNTVEQLRASGAAVLVVGPVPEIASNVPRALARAAWSGRPSPNGPTALEFNVRQVAVFRAFELVAGQPGVRIILPSDILCSKRCLLAVGGDPLYMDDNHLSPRGLALIKPLLSESFDALRGEQ